MGESPAAAAVREAREETGADVGPVRLPEVLGGPDYEVTYPNGDRTAYVTAVYEARIISGSLAPGDGELSEVAWFTPGQPFRPAAEPVRPRPAARRRPPVIHSVSYRQPAAGSMSSATRAECGM